MCRIATPHLNVALDHTYGIRSSGALQPRTAHGECRSNAHGGGLSRHRPHRNTLGGVSGTSELPSTTASELSREAVRMVENRMPPASACTMGGAGISGAAKHERRRRHAHTWGEARARYRRRVELLVLCDALTLGNVPQSHSTVLRRWAATR